MKNLQLKRLLLLSAREKAAQLVRFDPKTTVVLGENDTGKSCLIKSIYAAFGADAAKVNPTWLAAKVDIFVDFTVDGVSHSILRSGNNFGLYNGDGEAIWSGTGVTRGIGPELARLLSFELMLPDRNGELLTPPPAFLFLPFYVDQDASWVGNWNSFANLQMFSNYRKDVANFHAGLRPNEYYQAKALKAASDKARDELKVERRALDRASKRLRSNRTRLHFDLIPDQFADQIDALVAECQGLQVEQDKVQRVLSELNSKRAILVEQSVIAENALADLDADYEFLRRESEDEIICPTCGTVHSNDFANKFSLISDVDTCRGFLIEVRREIEAVDAQISSEKERLRSFSSSIERINGLLDEQRGELKLRDLIEGESEKLMDDTFAAEEKEIDSQIGAQEMKSDEATQSMKSFAAHTLVQDFMAQTVTAGSEHLQSEIGKHCPKSDVRIRVRPTRSPFGREGTSSLLSIEVPIEPKVFERPAAASGSYLGPSRSHPRQQVNVVGRRSAASLNRSNSGPASPPGALMKSKRSSPTASPKEP